MSLIAPNIRSIVDHDGAVILDAAHNSMLSFNATGGYVWEKLVQGKSIDEIVADLARDTGSDPATVDRDVRNFIEELKSNHLFIA